MAQGVPAKQNPRSVPLTAGGASARIAAMRRRLGPIVLAAALTLAASSAAAQDAARAYERYERGIAALEAKDAAKALPELEAAAAVFRRDPDVLFALAKAKALTGDANGALAALSRAVALGYGAGAD